MNQNPLNPANLIWAMSVSWLALIVSLCRKTQEKRWLDLTTVIGYASFGVFGGVAIILAMHFEHARDPIFQRMDSILGFNTLHFADMVGKYHRLVAVLWVSYILLPLLFMVVWVVEQNLQMRMAVLIGGVLGTFCYVLFPAVGPGNFDWITGLPHQGAPYNCMPSLHIAWPLLMLFNTRTRWLRVVLCVYVAMTGVSTLALREHYLIDLIAAVPFAVLVQRLTEHWEVYGRRLRTATA